MRKLLALALMMAAPLLASEWHVSPTGTGTTCSHAAPCDKTYGVNTKAQPGDTIWFHGGTYTVSGVPDTRIKMRSGIDEAHPTIIRNENNEHVIIDCNWDHAAQVVVGGGYCIGAHNNGIHDSWVWGLETTNSSTASRNTDNPNTASTSVNFSITRGKIINMVMRDGINAVLQGVNSVGPYGWEIYGNLMQYNGNVGEDRGKGHDLYIHGIIDPATGGCTVGTTCTWNVQDNIGLRAFDVGNQNFTTASENMRDGIHDGNVEYASGHPAQGQPYWDPSGRTYNFYMGASGGPVQSIDASAKVWKDMVWKENVSYGGSGDSFGALKGFGRVQIYSNYFLNTATGSGKTLSWTTGGSWPPIYFGTNSSGTVLPNVVDSSCANGGCGGGTCNTVSVTNPSPPPATIVVPCEPANDQSTVLNSTNYPNNTWALPTTTTKVYQINKYESNRGFVSVYNPTLAANVTISPTLMGCVGTPIIKIYNAQGADYWDDSLAVVRQTGCDDVSVPMTCTAPCEIRQPGFTTDGVTPFPKPPDIGPKFAVFIMVPDWDAAQTPTPTNTFTNTPTFTPTKTPTPTPSPTWTPSNTPTVTRTPTGTTTATFTPSNTPTNTPTWTLTPTFTPSLTPTSPNAHIGGGYVEVESAACVATSPGAITADVDAFGGYGYTSASGDTTNPIDGVAGGKLTCAVSIPAARAGTWILWARIKTTSSTKDSSYVSIGGEAVSNDNTGHIWDMGENRVCPAIPNGPAVPNADEYTQAWNEDYRWARVKDRGAANNCKGVAGAIGYNRTIDGVGGTVGVTLVGGINTITFYHREPDWYIDRIFLTQNPDEVPVDGSLTPTPTRTPCARNNCHQGRCKACRSNPKAH